MEQEITIVATITSSASAVHLVEAALIQVEREVQGEPGCKQYALYRNNEQPNQFVMLERWASREAMEEHGKGEPFLRFMKAIDGLADLSVTTLTKVS
ncbi:hypothetical protein GCM10011513_17400 [Franconibacter daqui]|uniref:putative quinol monooxygenase n=1 Tax=Franconibacter daqui TaxID=2047724 RepID=UPI00166E849F|nr:putative quinol monooxygenase [Franconibacter daqui]GGD20423.1 hypothetical protein GCM10011513_17400 [Franconibacter daqui]